MGWLRRVLKLEPSVSLGWWAVERLWSIFSNWTILSGLIGGSIMSYWSAVSRWADTYGPAVVGGIGIAAALVIMLCVSRIRLWNARRDLEKANIRYVEARSSMSSINPLADVFTSERIDLRDLTRPLTNSVSSKTFVRCQIVGPVNVVLQGNTNMANPNGIACEAVYANNGTRISNVIELIDCDFRNCEFFNVTFIVLPYQFDHFSNQISITWITENPRDYTFLGEGQMHFRNRTEEQPMLPMIDQPEDTVQNDEIAPGGER